METPPPSLCNLCSAPSLTVKKVFSDVQAKPCFSLYPLLLVPSLCTTEKPYLCLLLFPHTDDVLPEPSLFWVLSAFLHRRHCSPSIISVVLGCSLSSSPTSPLHWGAPDWTLQPQGTSAGEELQLPQHAPPRLPLVAGTINPLPWPLLLGHIAGSPPICRALGPQGLSWRMIPKPPYN